MYGAIHLWRVLPERRSEHDRVMRAVLDLEKRLAPEILLNLTFGPAEDGTCAEVQIYPDRAAADAFATRVPRDLPELAALWKEWEEVTDSARSLHFESMDLLAESFVRDAAAIGFVAGRHRLAGKVALVTGAHRGNGFGIARALAREGADVALLDLSLESLGPAREQIEALGRNCLTIEGDVTDEASVQNAIAATVTRFGGLDILVNNAGVFPFKPLDEFTSAEFARVLAVNVHGPWLLSKYAAAEMRRRGGGAIVNITSCSGHYGGASPGGSAYDASKGALRQLTYSLSTELGPDGIRVNAIAPGVVATEAAGGAALKESAYGKAEIARTPLRRLGEAADVGSVAAFLAGPDASYVNGVTVILDGGAMAAW